MGDLLNREMGHAAGTNRLSENVIMKNSPSNASTP